MNRSRNTSRNTTAIDNTTAIKSYNSLFEKGKKLFNEGRYQEAQKVFEDHLKTNPSHSLSIAYKGMIELKTKKPERALMYFLKVEPVLSKSNSRKFLFMNMAETYGELSSTERAVEYYDKVLAIDPENKTAIQSKAKLLGVDVSQPTTKKPTNVASTAKLTPVKRTVAKATNFMSKMENSLKPLTATRSSNNFSSTNEFITPINACKVEVRNPPENRVERKCQDSYNQIDKRARGTPKSEEKSLSSLAKYLTEPYHTVEEKSRSIFIWVTNNITYDTEAYFSGNLGSCSPGDVLRKKKSVCSGYSNIFQQLCLHGGVQNCVVISGYAKGLSVPAGEKFKKTNHAWNAVQTEDGEWHLVDSTWGAGHVEGGKFVKNFIDRYFFISPNELINSHLPEDDKWQLLLQHVTIDNFEQSLKIPAEAFSVGFVPISHPNAVYTLKTVARDEIKVKLNPGNNLLVNVREEKGSSVLWECSYVTEDSPGQFTILISLPTRVNYEVLIFATTKTNQSIFCASYLYKIAQGTKVDDSGFPKTYTKFNEVKAKIISPLEGQLKNGTTYHFHFIVPNCEGISLNYYTKFIPLKKNGDSFEEDYKIDSRGGTLKVFMKKSSTTFDGLLEYRV
ncbi:hypothetical protein ABK040_008380 [Willaertia magna]